MPWLILLHKNWKLVLSGIVLVALVACLAVSRFQAARWKQKYEAEASALIATKVNYANAQRVAADMNKKQVERIENEYAAIAEKSESDYEKRLTDNRANLAKFLRGQASKRPAQSAGTSGTAEMPAEAVPNTETALIPIEDLEIAADNYSQLTALIEWAKAVGEVDTAN